MKKHTDHLGRNKSRSRFGSQRGGPEPRRAHLVRSSNPADRRVTHSVSRADRPSTLSADGPLGNRRGGPEDLSHHAFRYAGCAGPRGGSVPQHAQPTHQESTSPSRDGEAVHSEFGGDLEVASAQRGFEDNASSDRQRPPPGRTAEQAAERHALFGGQHDGPGSSHDSRDGARWDKQRRDTSRPKSRTLKFPF